MSDLELGPVSVSVLTIAIAVVGTAFFCCLCCLLCPSYSEVRAGRASPYGGQKLDPLEEGTIWPEKRKKNRTGGASAV
ncbi:unnamed protein product [Pylaiella littoralis]